jgi:hypothetical protein
MDKETLYRTVTALLATKYHPSFSSYVYPQVVEQYNSLLETAKEIYPKRVDIQGLQKFTAKIHRFTGDQRGIR